MLTQVSYSRPQSLFTRLGLFLIVALPLALIVSAASLAQPLLPTALGPGVTSTTGGVAAGNDLYRINLDLGVFPDAQCNDGSPAVMYVRNAADPVHADRWLFHLQGGGSCRDGQKCADRWLNVNTNYGAQKMSSDFAPAVGIRGKGILSRDPVNNFAQWNQVYLYYCSSDGWGGRGHAVSSEATVPGGAVVPYTIHFHGADIIDAAVETLKRTAGVVTYLENGELMRTMPDLDDAYNILLTGSSAGGGGVTITADRFFEDIRSTNTNCSGGVCDVTFASAIDANYGPSRERLDLSTTQHCVENGICTYEELMMDSWANVDIGFWGSDGEASCLAFHAAAGEQWRCAGKNHILENHLMTPFFVRMDSQDNSSMGKFLAAGYQFGGIPATEEDFGEIVVDQLLGLESLAAGSEEARLASPLEPPGAFGAQCGDHVSITNDEPFLEVTAPLEASGAPLTTNQLLLQWFTGSGPREAIEPFVTSGFGGYCHGMFSSGFETGDTTEWSSSFP